MNDRSRHLIPPLAALILGMLFVSCAATPPLREPPERIEAHRILREGVGEALKGEWDSAMQLLHAAAVRFDAIADREGGGIARINQARLARRMGNISGAKRLLREVERFPPGVQETIDELHIERALLAEAAGDRSTALQTARDLARRDHPRTALVGGNMAGRILLERGEPEAGLSLLEGVSNRGCPGCEAEQGVNRLLRGRIALLRGEERRAVTLLEEGVLLFRIAGDGRAVADSLSLLSTLLRRGGDHEGALRAEEEAERIRTSIDRLRGGDPLQWNTDRSKP